MPTMHANHRSVIRRLLRTLSILLLTSAVWALAAYIARDTRRWAIELTNYLFALGLIISYAALWALRIIWARGPLRYAMFQAITGTVVLLISILIIEVPALLGELDYSRLWERLTGEWRGPAHS